MANTLLVDTYLQELGDDKTGMSNPVLVLCNDGNTYLLKNQNVYDPRIQKWTYWNSMFLHETVVNNIASHLNISTPEIAFIDVDSDTIEQNPTLRFKHRYEPGLHFGSMLVDGVENNILKGYRDLIKARKPFIRRGWTNFFKSISNKETIPRIIVLDILTCNFDRYGNIGNLLIAASNGTRKIYAIDHGHCFGGPEWNFHKKQFLTNIKNHRTFNMQIIDNFFKSNGGKPLSGMGEIFKAIDQHIELSDPNNHSFMEAVNLVEQITPDIIDSWFTNVPDQWYIQKDTQISSYKQYLMNHKNNIRHIISELALLGAFSDHTGGDLKWIEHKTGTQ